MPVEDALSSVLDILDVQVAASARLEAAGDWGLAFPEPGQLKVIAVLAGQCWLTAGDAEPAKLGERDCLLLAGTQGFTVGSSPDEVPQPQPLVLPGPWPPAVYYQATPGGQGDGRTILVSARLTMDRYAESLLLDRIPPAVTISAATAAGQRLGPVLDLLSAEAADPAAPGSQAVRRQLTHVLLIQVLRAVLATSPGPAGWLAALADPHVGAALAAIHAQPGDHWTVAGLARVAAMSRSAFAARFRELAGMPPLGYLITWRMHRAAHQLRTTTDSAATIGAAVGYPAETTFSTTFKRVIGQPPGRYRNAVRLAGSQEAAGRTRLALAKGAS
ncbi:MAG TPA: AraC family transcriptional regulator [Trebonia sp.]|nr:AraC family transcriptional regulator [Trebonia sp.]